MGVDLDRPARPRRARWPTPAASTRATPASSSASRSARAGRRGATRSACPTADGFGLWVEQLLAESTGKQGKGLVPAPGRVRATAPTARRTRCGWPTPTSSAQEFFRWEFATAVAGSILEINPFDQPDVQAAKDRTNEVLAAATSTLEPACSIEELLAGAEPRDYVCIQAFVEPTPANERADRGGSPTVARRADRLRRHARLRAALPALDRAAAQGRPQHRPLPAGGRGLRRRAADPRPAEFGFARLIRAQAAGDFESLRERGRRVARVQLEERCLMQLGMIGLGRMGGNMTERLAARRPRGEDLRPRGRLDRRDARRAPRPARARRARSG